MNRQPIAQRLLRLTLVGSVILMSIVCAAMADESDDEDEDEFWSEYQSGVIAQYVGDNGEPITRIDDQVSMIWQDRAPDPRIPPGSFRVKWTGRLKVWTPGEYRFRFFAAGRVQLKVADKLLLTASSDHLAWMDSKPIELEFGYLPLEIEYEKTSSEARIGFFWSGPKFRLEPVASHWLYHDTEMSFQDHFQNGQSLVRALRCAACHEFSGAQARTPGPALDQLSKNISSTWIRKWLMQEAQGLSQNQPDTGDGRRDANHKTGFRVDTKSEPAQSQTIRRMPQFGMTAEEADAIAAYLTTGHALADAPSHFNKREIESGRNLFHSLGCLACHRLGELGASGLFGGGDLTHIADKRPAAFFAEWLSAPAKLNRDHRMPLFDLDEKQRRSLAAFLSSLKAPSANTDSRPRTDQANAELIALGRKLVSNHLCGECHRLPDSSPGTPDLSPGTPDSSPGTIALKKTPFKKTTLSASSNWEQSCAGTSDRSTRRPGYGLSAERQTAVRTFVSASVNPHFHRSGVASIDAKSILEERNCFACHARGALPGIAELLPEVGRVNFTLERRLADMKPPALDSLGDKLADEALKAAISTQRKRRPWLHIQMPKFPLSPEEVSALTQFFIDVDRIPAGAAVTRTFDESKLRNAGTRLVTTDGFGCTSCHQIGEVRPTHVAHGAHGPDLSMLGRDIRKSWFARWMFNPIRISPRMEMPAVQIPIEGVLDTDLQAQYAALWNVLNRPGFQPPRPNPIRVLRRRNDPNTPEQTAIIIDNVEIGKHSYVKPILIGLTNRHNVLFDLTTHRLAAWWPGDAARQRIRGKYWYWEAGDDPFFGVESQQPETSLLIADQELLPLIDRDFPPEYEYLQQIEKGLELRVRLSFAADSLNPPKKQIRVTQSYTAISSRAAASGLSGFRRRIRFTQLPVRSGVRFRTAVAETLELSADRRTASHRDNRYRVIVRSDGVEFTDPKDGLIQLTASAQGEAELLLDYLTDAPVDQFLKPTPLSPSTEPERLHTVPGFVTQRLAMAEGLTPTALAWDQNDRLLVATLKGRLFRVTDTDGDGLEDKLTSIADGFSAPFGLARHTDENGQSAIDISDKTALCRLFDTTGDGMIDRIETAASGWGNNTDYHGWIVGLPRDSGGNYYAVVSNRDGPPAHFRGQVMRFNKRAPTADDPRRFSVEKLAVGLRFPVGIARNRAGDLFVTDNQGQYNPYNEINHVVTGAHFGFFNLSGIEDLPELKNMPKQGPAVGIPHPWVRSVNGICFLETPESVRQQLGRSLYGPFEGHLIGCEATTRGLVRVSLQKVGGRMQGADYPMTVVPERDAGRLLRPLVCQIAPNGDIYIGSVHDSAWGAGRNVGELARLRFTGKLPAGIAEMRMIEGGFTLDMTRPVDRKRALDANNYALVSYRRIPSSAYGAADSDYRRERIVGIEVAPNEKRISLRLESLRSGFVYELKLKNLTSDNSPFHPAEAHYTNGPLQQ